MITGAQIRAGRALVRMRQQALADAARVSLETIKRLERQDGQIGAQTATAAGIEAALESAGVVLIQEGGQGVGVKLRRE